MIYDKVGKLVGHCCVQYQVCDDDPTAFTLDGAWDDSAGPPPEFKTGSDSVCIEDYIGIEGGENAKT